MSESCLPHVPITCQYPLGSPPARGPWREVCAPGLPPCDPLSPRQTLRAQRVPGLRTRGRLPRKSGRKSGRGAWRQVAPRRWPSSQTWHHRQACAGNTGASQPRPRSGRTARGGLGSEPGDLPPAPGSRLPPPPPLPPGAATPAPASKGPWLPAPPAALVEASAPSVPAQASLALPPPSPSLATRAPTSPRPPGHSSLLPPFLRPLPPSRFPAPGTRRRPPSWPADAPRCAPVPAGALLTTCVHRRVLPRLPVAAPPPPPPGLGL